MRKKDSELENTVHNVKDEFSSSMKNQAKADRVERDRLKQNVYDRNGRRADASTEAANIDRDRAIEAAAAAEAQRLHHSLRIARAAKNAVEQVPGVPSAELRGARDEAVEIINKDLLIATLTADVPFVVEMVVENGRGYVSATEQAEQVHEIGIIPIDAVFSPVTRVRYDVEETRVGQKTNYDKLTIEIWTDGSIGPEMAIVESAQPGPPFFSAPNESPSCSLWGFASMSSANAALRSASCCFRFPSAAAFSSSTRSMRPGSSSSCSVPATTPRRRSLGGCASGASAVRAAAYRSGERMRDERSGK